MAESDAARTLHLMTRHGSRIDRSRLVDFRPLDPANRPDPFKRYIGREAQPLPADAHGPSAPAARVLSGGATAHDAPVDLAVLARLLYLAAGVTRFTGPPEDRTYFRAAMSAGNLHPIELYVVTGGHDGLRAGVHHFAPLAFGLTTVRDGEFRSTLAAAAADPDIARASAVLILTGVPWRTAWKYGERSFRHLYWDAGAILGNLLTAADAMSASARVLLGFVDDEVARLVGVDGEQEFPLALVALGRAPDADPAPRLQPLGLEVARLSAHPITFPLITEAQRAGDLRDAGAVARWREGAGHVARPPSREPVPLSSEPSVSCEEVLLRRGSTQIMRPVTAPRELLTWGMAVAARPVLGDWTAGRTLLEHYLATHGVDGVEPGAYRWASGALEQLFVGDVRDEAAHLCLDQPLAGDAAYDAFHAADLDGVFGALGARGYRAAQLEAGVAAERLALAAFTLGCGATGLTFFDDEVSRFFGTADACMLVTAVGVPAYRNTAGGRRPGEVTQLGRYEQLMQQLWRRLRP